LADEVNFVADWAQAQAQAAPIRAGGGRPRSVESSLLSIITFPELSDLGNNPG